MAEKTLIARVSPDPAGPGTTMVSSPAVGLVDGLPRMGTYLNPHDRILTIRILNERCTVRLPRDVQGRVVEVCIPDALTPVAFGEHLLRITTREAETVARGGSGAGREARLGTESVDHEGITIASPSVGIFYRRSAPDAEPYVEVGSSISTGSLLGLVEVMKCFNQIVFGGADLPSRGTVTEILAEDGSEVQFGQPLFRIRASE
jgi:biotin carboxyl carrier protein